MNEANVIAREYNFDGLVGASHHYGGLAHGNLAAQAHSGQVADPRAAALQGLAKMRRVLQSGCAQGWLPPPLRPDWEFLSAIGFEGAVGDVLGSALKTAPDMLQAAWSAASMWTANAATVTPSTDSRDGQLHLSVANLSSQLHRSLEAAHTHHHLRGVFRADGICVHAPLPAVPGMSDEGAANHTRLCASHADPGVHIFVYGRDGERFRARQSLRASQAIARRHQLAPEQCIFVEQSRAAIDAGVFHNDVISVGHRHLLLSHEDAFETPVQLQEQVDAAVARLSRPFAWASLVASRKDFALADAVKTYVFNSQLLDDADGGIWLLGPDTINDSPGVVRWLNRLVDEGHLTRWETMDLTQSMQNGGGPACLRLRVAMSEDEARAVRPEFLCDEERISKLEGWVKRHYRDRLRPADLADPQLASEIQRAHEELAALVGWPGLLR